METTFAVIFVRQHPFCRKRKHFILKLQRVKWSKWDGLGRIKKNAATAKLSVNFSATMLAISWQLFLSLLFWNIKSYYHFQISSPKRLCNPDWCSLICLEKHVCYLQKIWPLHCDKELLKRGSPLQFPCQLHFASPASLRNTSSLMFQRPLALDEPKDIQLHCFEEPYPSWARLCVYGRKKPMATASNSVILTK